MNTHTNKYRKGAKLIGLIICIAMSFNTECIAQTVLSNGRHKAPQSITDLAEETLQFMGIPYEGRQTSADVYIHYSSENQSRKIKKPLLVVEGFFPNWLNEFGFHNPIREEVINSVLPIFPEMDLIYVAWQDAEAPIEANSETLKIILLWLQEELKRNNATQRITLIGHSMGGLIGRWALTQMEASGLPHGVGLYVSYDSPHLGAHFPLGLAYGVQGASELAFTKKQFFKYLPSVELFILTQMDEVMHSASAEQMVLQNVLLDGKIDNSRHKTWVKKLQAAGLPRGDKGHNIECLAISNSDGKKHSALEQAYIDMHFETKSVFTGLFGGIWDFSSAISNGILLNDVKASILSVLPGSTRVRGRVYCAPGHQKTDEITRLEVTLEKKLFYFIPIYYTIYSYQKSYPNNTDSYDYDPSSFWPMGGIRSKNSSGIPVFRSFKYKIASTMAMPFIPMNSALAIGTISPHSEDGTDSSLFHENIFIADEPLNHNVLSEKALRWIKSKTPH